MAFRAFDIAAVVVTAFAVLLPEPPRNVYADHKEVPAATLDRIADLQARTQSDPKGVDNFIALADTLLSIGEYEGALRTIDPIAKANPTLSRSTVAAADAWIQVYAFDKALPYAERALFQCGTDAQCGMDQRVRLSMYADAIRAVVKSGIDPKNQPEKLREILDRLQPTIRLDPPQ